MNRFFSAGTWALLSLFAAGCSGAGDPPPPMSVEASPETRPTPSSAGVCQNHEEGCPCDEPDQVVECGRFKRVEGNYVWCATGHQTCSWDGVWGKCTGDVDATSSAPAQ